MPSYDEAKATEGTACEAVPAGDTVDTAANNVREAVGKLDALLSALVDHLRPVLRETDPMPETADKRASYPYSSPLCSHLVETTWNVESMQGRVDRLIQRLDLTR